ncbi:MAG: sulfatase [Deltaproteobacteria bacterium]|nr:sulfatase [Deltaproteobacteria bacterium]
MRSSARLVLLRGALPGAAVFAALFAADLALGGGFKVFGEEARGITEKVFGEYLWTTVAAQLRILGAFLFVGGLLGAAVLLCWRGLLGRWPGHPAFAAASLALLVHSLAVAAHVQLHPQLYAEGLCMRGPFLAALQKTITHGLPRWPFHAALLLGLALIVGAVLRFRRTVLVATLVATLVAALAAVLAFSLIRPGTNGGSPARPNILVVANDSMRPDRLGFNGYGRPTSPRVDAFSRQAVVFDEAYVPLARTFPSWATILTGRLPHEHGVRHMFPRPEHRLRGAVTLPRVLGQAGYRTAAVADYAGDVFPRMDAGFETVEAPDFNFPALIRQRSLNAHAQIMPYLENSIGLALFPDILEIAEMAHAGTTTDSLLARIDAGDGRPFFIVAFYSSSHFPYVAPYPYYRLFGDPTAEGPGLYMRYRKLRESALELRAGAKQMNALFDGTIRAFDDQFGRVLDHLARRGLDDRTVVVLLADHGEMLGEYDTTGHGDHLRGREAHKVPLLVRAPGLAAHRVPGLVRTQDLARTLTKLVGIEPPSAFGGADLGPLLRGERSTLQLVGLGETGIWFTSGGGEFFERERIPYPDLTVIAETRPDFHGEVCVRPDWDDLVVVAKHRAAWSETRKVIYAPAPAGIVRESMHVENGREVMDGAIDPALSRELDAFMAADGEVVGGYVLPRAPVAEP